MPSSNVRHFWMPLHLGFSRDFICSGLMHVPNRHNSFIIYGWHTENYRKLQKTYLTFFTGDKIQNNALLSPTLLFPIEHYHLLFMTINWLPLNNKDEKVQRDWDPFRRTVTSQLSRLRNCRSVWLGEPDEKVEWNGREGEMDEYFIHITESVSQLVRTLKSARNGTPTREYHMVILWMGWKALQSRSDRLRK